MARNLALLLAFVFTFRVALAANATDPDKTDRRSLACSFCHKLCPISCFVGTCGVNGDKGEDRARAVRRFGKTDKCFSCDPAVSVGISKDGDYMGCNEYESGSAKSPFAQQKEQGPQGPAVPGNAGESALKASQQAKLANQAITKAIKFADTAAKAAVAKYTGITGTGDKEAALANARTAILIRTEASLRKSEKAHQMWQEAMVKYNVEVAKLRKEQVQAKFAEHTLEDAEATSNQARGVYAGYQAEAQHAITQAMLNGGKAAAKISAQQAAEELAGAATAAHRRLVIAAMEAKEAAQKLSIASTMVPCKGRAFLQVAGVRGAPPVINCNPIAETEPQDSATDAKILRLTPPQPTDSPPAPTQLAVEPGFVEDPTGSVSTEGQIPNVEQQMTARLEETLESNPAAISDPSLFAVPQTAVQDPSFDFSAVSALQTSQRGNLRQGKMQA